MDAQRHQVRVQVATYLVCPEDLRAARIAAGLTQRDVAPSLGITQPTLARWERGKRPALVTAEDLAALMAQLRADPVAA